MEKTESNPNGNTVDKAIVVVMKGSKREPFLFADIPDRDFVVEKISDMLAKLKESNFFFLLSKNLG